MKKELYIKRAFIIIIVLIAGLNLFKKLSYIMKPDGNNLRSISGFYGEKRNSLDMVYIGGSAAFVYWEPVVAFEKSGIASYSYASDTIQVELYKTMIKEVLRTQNPKLIVIDARALQYREKDQPPTEVAYLNALTGMPFSLNKLEYAYKVVEKYLKESDPNLFFFDIIKYHRDVKGLTVDLQLEIAKNKYSNQLKGFYFVPSVAEFSKNKVNTTKKTKPDKETDKLFLDLLDFCKTTEVEYLFIVSPYIETNEHKEIFNYAEEMINKYGYDFVDANDYYDEMDIDFKKDFYNVNHVNIFGADKYTDFLLNYLKKYNLPDRRNDDAYQEWYDLIPVWENDYNDTKAKIEELLKG